MVLALDVLTRAINVHWGRDVIVVFVDGPAYTPGPARPPSEYLLMCKTGPSDIKGVVQGNANLSCGNFLDEAGLLPGTPIDPNAEWLFYHAQYGDQCQIREVWWRPPGTPGGDSLPHAGYEVNKATFLERWTTHYPEGFEFQCSAYKVAAGAGEFIKSTAPTGLDPNRGIDITAIVFAIENASDMAGSLQRAKNGIEKILPAQYGPGDPPADMAPPGLLWSVMVKSMNSGQIKSWKIRHGAHRPEDADNPLPNAMTQCYPLGPNYLSGTGTTWSGYYIFAYRLDTGGTDIVYGKRQPDGSQNIDPTWHQPIGGDRGIPFKDPPPLIDADLV